MTSNIILVNTKHLFTMMRDGYEQVEPVAIKRIDDENYYEMQKAGAANEET